LEEFFKYINDSVNTQLHKHVLMTMGGDFHVNFESRFKKYN